MAKKPKLPAEATPVEAEAEKAAKPARKPRLAKKKGDEIVAEAPVEALAPVTDESAVPDMVEDPAEAPEVDEAARIQKAAEEKAGLKQKKLQERVEVFVRDSGVVRKAKTASHDAFEEASEVGEGMKDTAQKVGSVVDKLAARLDVMDTLIDNSMVDERIEEEVNKPDTGSKPKAGSKPAASSQPNVGISTDKKAPVPGWQQHRQTEIERAEAEKRSIEEKKRAIQTDRSARDNAHIEKLRAERMALEEKQRSEREQYKERMRTEREAMDAKLKEERERLRQEREAYEAARRGGTPPSTSTPSTPKDAGSRNISRLTKEDD